MERFKFLAKNKLDELPKTSGVYAFKSGADLIYIGKAINIKNRVKNHFQRSNYRDELFIGKINKIGYLETGSEIEALILEASLIKKYQPKFNIVWRDDKNYFYVALRYAQGKLTDKKIPYVYITHQKNEQQTIYIGPFVEGAALKKTLRFLRRAFPYYALRSGSGQTFKHPKIKCTWCHLGLCPGPNPDLMEYKKNIKELILILRGERNAVLNSLEKEMRQLSRENKFEEAGKTRDKIYNLQQVMAHPVIRQDALSNDRAHTANILAKIIGAKSADRIECYDVSNIQGKFATGSMVAFVNGKPDKTQYKKFKIKIENKPNDIAMLKEILERRLAHPEWKFPEIILVDGGIAQLNIATKTKNKMKAAKNIKVLSLAKRNKNLYIEGRKNPVSLKTLSREIYNLILQLDDEAHRFAIAYHKKLRKNSLLI